MNPLVLLSLFFALAFGAMAWLGQRSPKEYLLGRKALVSLGLVQCAQWLCWASYVWANAQQPTWPGQEVFQGFVLPALFWLPLAFVVMADLILYRLLAKPKP